MHFRRLAPCQHQYAIRIWHDTYRPFRRSPRMKPLHVPFLSYPTPRMHVPSSSVEAQHHSPIHHLCLIAQRSDAAQVLTLVELLGSTMFRACNSNGVLSLRSSDAVNTAHSMKSVFSYPTCCLLLSDQRHEGESDRIRSCVDRSPPFERPINCK